MNTRRTFFGWLGTFLSAPFAPNVSAGVIRKPHVGDDVLYVLSEGKNKGQTRPAKVIRICDDGTVNLSVIPDGDEDSLPEKPEKPKKTTISSAATPIIFDDKFITLTQTENFVTLDWQSPPATYITFPGLPFYKPGVKYDASGAPGTWKWRD